MTSSCDGYSERGDHRGVRFQVRCGRRVLKGRPADGPSVMEALKDYAIRQGARREEIVILGPNKISWLGMTYEVGDPV